MKFVKYDITFETEREVFIAYGFPPPTCRLPGKV